MILDHKQQTVPPCTSATSFPAAVNLVMSALEAGGDAGFERRQARSSYRVIAQLRLFNEPGNVPPWLLYTRDVSSRSLGFITPHRLPLGYGGTVTLAGPDGNEMSVTCTLFRCREAAPGWYEGALSFSKDQWVFASGDE